MEDIAQILVSGVPLGATYVLISLGFAMVYGSFKVLQFAHGSVYMIGGLVTAAVASGGMNYLLALLVGAVVAGLASVLLERGVFRPLAKAPVFDTAVAFIAVATIVQQGAINLRGPDPVLIDTPLDGVLRISGPVGIRTHNLLVLGASILLIVLVYVLVHHTRLGTSVRGVSQDPVAAGLVGINAGLISLTVFAIGGLLAGVAGGLVGAMHPLDPFVGLTVLLKSFVIVVLGGFSVVGVAVAGITLGLIESGAALYLSSEWTGSISFGLMLAFLIWRPTGLVAEKVDENV